MVVKTLENKKAGNRIDIFMQENGLYGYRYFEFYGLIGWKQIGEDETDYSKEWIEEEFETKIA